MLDMGTEGETGAKTGGPGRGETARKVTFNVISRLHKIPGELGRKAEEEHAGWTSTTMTGHRRGIGGTQQLCSQRRGRFPIELRTS